MKELNERALCLLKKVKPHIESINADSEAKYDNEEDECYESYCLYDIMRETEIILKEIDELLKEEGECR